MTSWRKSTYSVTENCLEAGSWHKSSHCEAGACTEVAMLSSAVVGVRDTTDRDGIMLQFSATAWRSFIRTVKR